MNCGGSFLVEPCSSNWKGAGNPRVWRALEPLFERSVIFQSNSLPKPPFIKYSWDPFSPGTPSPRLSPENQSGSSACSNASAFSGAWGCHLLPPPPSVPVPSPGSGDGWGCAGSGSAGKAAGRSGMRTGGMQQQQQREEAATLWGRAGGAPLHQDLSRVPTLCRPRGFLPILARAAAADVFAFMVDAWRPRGGCSPLPSPPLPSLPLLPSGAFDAGPAVNGFVTELCILPTAASLRPRGRLLAWERCWKSVLIPRLLPLPHTLGLYRGGAHAGRSAGSPSLELSGWGGRGGQGSRGAA